MQKTEFKNVLLSEITEDKNQPRKYFDEVAMKELAENVAKVGVLSPIMIRPDKAKAGHFFVVFGERRFRAAKAAGLKDIPAQIRDITAEEALDLQIIENLQRKDVHAMEEAIAFKSFRENQKWSTLEIGSRIGKDDRYVRGRLVLCNLIDTWQKIFYQNSISLTAAMKIASLGEWAQKQLFNDRYKHQKITPGEILTVSLHDIKQLTGNLKEAPFDTMDKELNKAAGTCDICPFNSAVSSLFPGDEKEAKCNNIQCFKGKTEKSFSLMHAKAKETPDMIYIFTDYLWGEEIKTVNKLAGGGKLLERGAYEIHEEPEKPVIEDYDVDNYDTKKERDDDFKDDLKRYDAALDKFKKYSDTGKLKQAFILSGKGKGTFVLIKPNPVSKQGGKAEISKKAIEAEPWLEFEEDIKGIQEREKRALQLDENKIWAAVYTKICNPKLHSTAGTPLSGIETIAAAQAIYNKLSYTYREAFKKTFPTFHAGDYEKSKVSTETLNKMFRYFVMDALPPTVIYSGYTPDAELSLQLLRHYDKAGLEKIEGEFQTAITKRRDRVTERISALKKKVKELKNQAATKTELSKLASTDKKAAPKKKPAAAKPVTKKAKK